MSKLLSILGVLGATASFGALAPALARGNSGGHMSVGVHSAVKMQAPVVHPAVTSHQEYKKHHVKLEHIERLASTNDKHRSVAKEKSSERISHVVTKSSPPKPHLETAKKHDPIKINGTSHKTVLTASQYQRAKIADLSGRSYDPMKKAWWDGRHWWFGRYAWLFIDGTWYYGNSVWTESDGMWTSDVAEQPTCLNCQTVVQSLPTSPDDAVPLANPKRHVVSKAAVEQAPAKTPTTVTAQVAGVGIVAPAPLAEVAKTPIVAENTTLVATADIASAQPAIAAPAQSEADQQECKIFLPQLGMTVSVPCSK